jgi:hypothetical protein
VPRVASLAVNSVRGFALQQCDEVRLADCGVRENRRFFLVEPGRVRVGDPVEPA